MEFWPRENSGIPLGSPAAKVGLKRGEGREIKGKGEMGKGKINLLELNFPPKSPLWLKNGKRKGENQFVGVALTSQSVVFFSGSNSADVQVDLMHSFLVDLTHVLTCNLKNQSKNCEMDLEQTTKY